MLKATASILRHVTLWSTDGCVTQFSQSMPWTAIHWLAIRRRRRLHLKIRRQLRYGAGETRNHKATAMICDPHRVTNEQQHWFVDCQSAPSQDQAMEERIEAQAATRVPRWNTVLISYNYPSPAITSMQATARVRGCVGVPASKDWAPLSVRARPRLNPASDTSQRGHDRPDSVNRRR
jgi:hypothetical protein